MAKKTTVRGFTDKHGRSVPTHKRTVARTARTAAAVLSEAVPVETVPAGPSVGDAFEAVMVDGLAVLITAALAIGNYALLSGAFEPIAGANAGYVAAGIVAAEVMAGLTHGTKLAVLLLATVVGVEIAGAVLREAAQYAVLVQHAVQVAHDQAVAAVDAAKPAITTRHIGPKAITAATDGALKTAKAIEAMAKTLGDAATAKLAEQRTVLPVLTLAGAATAMSVAIALGTSKLRGLVHGLRVLLAAPFRR